MDSSLVQNVLQEHFSRCFDCVYQLEEYYEELELWKDYLKDEVKEMQKNKKKLPVIPSTPAAFRKRIRRHLSVIAESDGVVQELKSKDTKKFTLDLEDSRRATRSSESIQNVVVEETIPDISKKSANETLEQTPASQNTSHTNSAMKGLKVVVKRLTSEQIQARSLGSRSSTRSIASSSRKRSEKSLVICLQDAKEEIRRRTQNLGSDVANAGGKSETSLEKQKNSLNLPNIILVDCMKKSLGQNSLSERGNDRASVEKNVNTVENHTNAKGLECGITIEGFTRSGPNNKGLEESEPLKSEGLAGKGKASQASSAYYSMDGQNSSYMTAASPPDSSAVSSSCRHSEVTTKSTEEEDLAPKKNVEFEKAIKSPSKAAKSPYLFSPYANDPVKKRVAAFENLNCISAEIMKTNKRVTRSKARALVSRACDKNASLMNHSRKSATKKVVRKSVKIALKKFGNKNNDASKENSILYSSKKTHIPSGSKVLSDVNGLSFNQSLLNTSKNTRAPLTGPRVLLTNICSTGQPLKSAHKPGVILTGTEIFIMKAVKQPVDDELKRKEELEKMKEREKVALQRKEELMKKRAEEQRKKEEKRLKVIQNREAKEKEKQESQLRVGKERDEKFETFRHEREVKQKEQALKKRLEAEKKATEARRKIEEAEATRAAKLKLEEEQRKKEQEEIEKERKRRAMEEKEEAQQRAKVLQKMVKEVPKGRTAAHAEKQTAAAQLDSTFTVPSTGGKQKLNSTFTLPSVDVNNILNLQELESGSSDDDDYDSDNEADNRTAVWANRHQLCWESKLDVVIAERINIFASKELNAASIFPKSRKLKRTSSAKWETPVRYSTLPKY